jgi:CopG antitoxin of type II toxin-antitoxin system
MDENKRSSISNATSLEQIGELWDTHDFTEHDTDAPDVPFTIARAVQIEAELLAALEQQARLRGVGLETLVNLWLQQKLSEEAQPAAT